MGQPELEEKLAKPELRQLDQRIGIRCYLRPLSRKETFRYIEHRLRTPDSRERYPLLAARSCGSTPTAVVRRV